MIEYLESEELTEEDAQALYVHKENIVEYIKRSQGVIIRGYIIFYVCVLLIMPMYLIVEALRLLEFVFHGW